MAGKTASAKGPYGVHPGVSHSQAMVANLPEKTGRSLDEWLKLLTRENFRDRRLATRWLKGQQKLGTGTALLIVDHLWPEDFLRTDAKAYLKAAPRYVDHQFAGPKAKLRPIFDAVAEVAGSLGDDVKVCPCKTIIPVYRKHVIAEVKATTRTRVDLGLALKGAKQLPPKRLLAVAGRDQGARITHRIALEAVEGVDDFVEKWLGVAYDLDG